MIDDVPPLRWLAAESHDRPGAGERLLVQQVMRFVLHLEGFNGRMTVSSQRKANQIENISIKKNVSLTQPTVVFTAMPSPALPGEKAVDTLLLSPGIQLLLANPLAFVVFVTPLSRIALDDELRRWIGYGSQNKIASSDVFRYLSTRQLVGWSFLTLDELSCPVQLQDRLKGLRHLAHSVATDVTGLRSLLHLLVSEGSITSSDSAALPPRYALVVDDEHETAARLSFLIRRWGYSVLTIDRPSAWNWIDQGSLDLGHHFELAVVDNVLGFSGAPGPQGHDWLRSQTVQYKIYKTSATDHESLDDEIHIDPQVADHHQLRRFCRQIEPEWEPQGVLFRSEAPTGLPDLHSHLRGRVTGIGHRLVNRAYEIEKRKPRVAALYRLEAFSLVKHLDGPLAAGAFTQLQEFEVETLCDRTPGALEPWILKVRLTDIRRGIKRCFDNENPGDSGKTYSHKHSRPKPISPNESKRTRLDAGLWTSRTLSRLADTLKRHPIPSRLHQIVEAEQREQHWRNRLLSDRGGRWGSLFFPPWNFLSRQMMSFQRVALAWLTIVLAFGGVYTWREAAALGISLLDTDTWLRGLGASISCGIGFLYPHIYDFSIPPAELYVIEFFQRSLAVLLLAKAVKLAVDWLRYGS